MEQVSKISILPRFQHKELANHQQREKAAFDSYLDHCILTRQILVHRYKQELRVKATNVAMNMFKVNQK